MTTGVMFVRNKITDQASKMRTTKCHLNVSSFAFAYDEVKF